MKAEPIHISFHTPGVVRWGLSAFGLVLIGFAGKDLLRALWPMSAFTPVFALLMGTGVAAGVGLIVASQCGPDERWRIADGRLTIVRSLGQFRSEVAYTTRAIFAIHIDIVDKDSGPDAYRLVVVLNSGKRLNSPNFVTLARAEAARDRLLANSPQ
ncbi:hypothetical protein AEAC466_19515 [Asticcacaulis sp. AC466]|uniref:hypothetical protein n=1 Tax=Asticcacaulis sp. AC466 TaxID=1282362 RepID=UPI0003C3CEF2|nr:hypothetical protein [Asticcacaulis sp. AC466]ESQ81921.1 hypothetical protein AEAC466_19515 [Asticcacaulis sp. AC466]